MRYVIIYACNRAVQGHGVFYLVSRVNILLQRKVQRITPTSFMQVSTVVLYHFRGIVCPAFRCQFYSCGGIVGYLLLNEINFVLRCLDKGIKTLYYL